MINKDLYPTPIEVFYMMTSGVDLEGRTVLDPSAGYGNLLDFANTGSDKYAYEIEPRLRNILSVKKYNILGNDFLKANPGDIDHINLILMNPPFSADCRHILHAYNIAPGGCEIIALCNSETLRNDYSTDRKRLKTIIQNEGLSTELGQVFQEAERKTDVEVSLIRIFKPQTKGEFDYSIFFLDEDDVNYTDQGLISYNEVESIVNSYVSSLKEFELIEKSINRINELADNIGLSNYDKLKCTFGRKDTFISKHEYARQLQHMAWMRLFDRFNIRKYFTREVNEKLTKFINSQQRIPFTMKNIYIMIDMIFQTREQNLNEALVQAVDSFTMHTHDNRYNVEGWKTNKGHLLAPRFIIDNMVSLSYSGNYYNISRSNNRHRMEDLIKVLCNLSGEDYDNIEGSHLWVKDNMNRNTWYSILTKEGKPVFFDFKFYKKGTMHVRFRDSKLWERLNRTYAKIKGANLPERI